MPEAYFKLPNDEEVKADPRLLNLPEIVNISAPYADNVIKSLKEYFRSHRPIREGMTVAKMIEALDDIATDAVDMRTLLNSTVAMVMKIPINTVDKLMKYPIAILSTTLMLTGGVQDKEVAFGIIAAIKRLDKFLEELGYVLDQLYSLPEDAILEVIGRFFHGAALTESRPDGSGIPLYIRYRDHSGITQALYRPYV